MTINQQKLEQFVGRAVNDIGAAMSAAMCLLGERLGLYQALAETGPATPKELADSTGTNERCAHEWLMNQAAGGYVEYDPVTRRFALTPEQAFALADPDSPAYMHGAFEVALSVMKDMPKIEEAMRTGRGLAWYDHDHCLFSGTERFFRSSYRGNLLQTWIPAIDGMQARLESGAKVADIGCGHGASTIIMAKRYPKSQFNGFDFHPDSIQRATLAAEEAGVNGNLRFEVAAADAFRGGDYDFVTFFDCLHDMGDPIGAMKHARKSLRQDGAAMIVEPYAGDKPEDNLTPVGRIFYAASTMICVPNSLAFDGPALGAQAGENGIKQVAEQGGFSRFRRASQTPFNLVFEARP